MIQTITWAVLAALFFAVMFASASVGGMLGGLLAGACCTGRALYWRKQREALA